MNSSIASLPRLPDAAATPPRHPIAEQVTNRLVNSLYPELRDVRCNFSGGVLSMSGVVPSFYLKQVITSMAEGIDGIEQINNGVEVLDWLGQSPTMA